MKSCFLEYSCPFSQIMNSPACLSHHPLGFHFPIRLSCEVINYPPNVFQHNSRKNIDAHAWAARKTLYSMSYLFRFLLYTSQSVSYLTLFWTLNLLTYKCQESKAILKLECDNEDEESNRLCLNWTQTNPFSESVSDIIHV